MNLGDLTPLSSTLSITSSVKLSYEVQGTDFLLLVESTSPYTWFGVGFGSTMTNTDMLVFFPGTQTVSAYRGQGQITPTVSPLQNWSVLGSANNSGGFQMKVKRALNTGANEFVFSNGSTYTFCSAWSTQPGFNQHDDRLSYIFNLSNNQGSTNAQTVSIGVSQSALNVHKVWLFYGWGIGTDVAIFIGRYLKAWKHHITFHALLFFILNVSTIVLEAIVINGNDYKLGDLSKVDKEVKNHFIIGCVILAIIIIQHIGGVILKFGIEGTNKRVPLIKKFHLCLGLIIYALAKTNLLIGSDINSTKSDGVIITIISVLFLFFSEIFYRFYHYKTRHQIYDYNYTQVDSSEIEKVNPEYTQLMKLLNQERRDPQQIIAAIPNVQWVVYNQGVYDVTKYLHPGGAFIIQKVIGKEIGRYLSGALPLEGHDTLTHTHSSTAIKQLKSKLIGYLNYGESNMVVPINEESNTNGKRHLFTSYKVISKDKVSNNFSKFSFQSDSLQVKNVISGVHWIGRHFQLKSKQANKSRLYTQLNCMTNDNIIFRQQLIEYTTKSLANQPAHPVDIKTFNRYSSTLPFIIKKYDFSGALSKIIHEDKDGAEYQIQGPLGTGLGFNEYTANQKYAILCGGTGVLPFLDLFDFLLKKQFQQSLPNLKKELDPFSLEYDQYFSGCSFQVLAAFAQPEDFIGREWITLLNQLSNSSKNNLFNMKIKLSKGSLPDGDGFERIQDNFKNIIINNMNNDSYDKIFICGPPQMYTQILEALKKKDIDEAKIHIV